MKFAQLKLLDGPQQGICFDLSGSLTIGRSPENNVQINDLQVSRKHAVVHLSPRGALLRDLGSGNGTFVANRRIIEYLLTNGDVIAVGSHHLLFEASTAQQSGMTDGSVTLGQGDAGNLMALPAESIRQTFMSAPEAAQTSDEARRAQKRLAAVYEANQIISSERDLRKLFERVMDQIFSLVPAHNGVILLADPGSGELQEEYVKSGSADHLTISSTIVHRAFENAEAVLTRDAADDSRFSARGSIIAQNIASAMCAPLCHHGETLGVVYVDTRGTTNAFSEEDRELLVALTGPAAIAIKNAQYLRKLEQAYQDTLVMTANAIEARDHYTVGHTWRVTHFATEIARALGWSDERIRECEMGGVLHDVGKIAIDDAILRKPSQLTDEEYAKMKIHPERGARMMRDVESLVSLIPYALYHHERYDGKGYPFQLAGDDIPIEGRIVAVADTFDAMTSNRPYRKGLDAEVAIKEIEAKAGSQFDPAVVEAFCTCYQEGRIERIQQEYYKGDRSVICPFCSTHIRIPEDAAAGTEFQCGVCHRRNRLQIRNEAYFAELIPEAESLSPPPSSDLPQA